MSTKSSHNSNPNKYQKPSKVLMVCVYDTIVFQLTNDIIYAKFQKYGPILKLLIFEKGEVTFTCHQCIINNIQAKQALDNTKLCQNICKMTIYFSNFNNVDLKHQTSNGVDYIVHEQQKNTFIKKFDVLSKGSEKQFQSFHQEIMMASFDNFGLFNRSKTDDPRLLQNHIRKFNNAEQQSMQQQLQIPKSFIKSIDSLLDSTQIERSNNKDKTPKLKDQTPLKTSILGFKIIEGIQIYNVYNLFSNFGNISWIIKKKNSVYIKFRSIQFAAISYSYLNNKSFLGILINLNPYENQVDILPYQGQYSECIFYDFLSDRFTAKRSITINPPSASLHISSIKKQMCKEHVLRKIFGQYGDVEKVHILHQSNQKNMALIKYFSIENSFKAISNLHNKFFHGRKIQISFTKSKF